MKKLILFLILLPSVVMPAFSDGAFSFTLVNEKLTLSMDAFVRKGRFPLLNFYWRESTIIGFGFTLKG